VKELLKGINTIIFDLGEVIIDLHPDKVINELSYQWQIPSSKIKSLIVEHSQLIDYETGRIDEAQMLESIQHDFTKKISLKEFEYSWNLMIGDISDLRKKLLVDLRKNFNLLFLSNTNTMHERAFDQQAKDKFSISALSALVDHAYYSHKMGLRKPDQDIYRAVIDQQNLVPEQCLFFDDREENLHSASEIGINTFKVLTPNEILGLT
jgi:putative hydrolase of the HAD superfamily